MPMYRSFKDWVSVGYVCNWMSGFCHGGSSKHPGQYPFDMAEFASRVMYRRLLREAAVSRNRCVVGGVLVVIVAI